MTPDDARYRELDALPPGAGAVQALLTALKDESWRVRRLAAERLGELEPTNEVIAALTSLLASRDEPGARNAAAAVLGQLGAPVLPSMLALLRHEDAGQRKFAAEILGALARSEAVPPLLTALDDTDANVRVAAAEALSQLGGPQARAALEALLQSPDVMLRVCALNGLAALRLPPPLPALLPLLEDALTRRSAWRLLGHVDHPTVSLLTVRALATPLVRDAALASLAAPGHALSNEFEADLRAALRPVPGVRDWLAAALESSEDERREGAMRVVRALGDAALAVPLAASVRGARDGELAVDTLTALGPRAAHALLASPETLAGLAAEAHAVVADAIVRLAEPNLVPALSALIETGEPELAELAARALGRTRSREAIAPLLTLLDDDALAMHCYRSLVTLAESWSDEVRQALAPLTTRPLRPHTVRAWAEIAGEDAVGVIRRAMHDADPAVRAAGAQASRFTPSETLSTLRQALMDESAVVRRGAVRTLGQLAAADAEPLLTRALADSDASVLALACEAAGRAGALSLVPRLLAHSRHADAAVVLGALEALGLLGQLDDDTLIAAATHADAEVLKLVFSFGADRALLVSHAHAQLGHARWDVRVAAARLLAVSATRDALPAMLDAVTREADDVARGLLAAAAEALAKRV